MVKFGNTLSFLRIRKLGENKWWALTLCTHLLAVYFSIGFFHFDEFFQIAEFANFKLGLTPASDLPWEYTSKIRPWLLPGIFYTFIQGLTCLGLSDPFHLLTAFRFLSAIVALLSQWMIWKLGCEWLSNEKEKKIYLILLSTLWFLPFLHVRTSSENWSGAFFIFGAYFFLRMKHQRWDFLWAGILLGLAFQFRYQIAFLLAPLFIWWLWQFRKLSKKTPSLYLMVGFGIATLLSFFVDRWGYGEWVFAPFRYFWVNLVENKAASYGISPMWDYLRLVFLHAIPPISLLIMGAFLILWGRLYKHPLSLPTLIFFLIHSFVAHKELRFLFPIITLIPIIIVLAYREFSFRDHKEIAKVIGGVLVVVNSVLLLFTILTPQRIEWGIFRFLQKNLEKKFVHFENDNPFYIAGNHAAFLESRLPKLRMNILHTSLQLKAEEVWFLSSKVDEAPEGCTLAFTTLPSFFKTPYGRVIAKRAKVGKWNAYHCK